MLYETAVGSGKYTEIPAGASSFVEDWTDDGKYLVTRAERKVRLLTAPQPESPPKGDDKPQTILEVAFGVDQIRVSPDGRGSRTRRSSLANNPRSTLRRSHRSLTGVRFRAVAAQVPSRRCGAAMAGSCSFWDATGN